jgi:hypothetical protein
MKYYRSLALAASLAAGLALPAAAQNAAPMPDAGVRKAAPTPVNHTHRVTHHGAKAVSAPAKH